MLKFFLHVPFSLYTYSMLSADAKHHKVAELLTYNRFAKKERSNAMPQCCDSDLGHVWPIYRLYISWLQCSEQRRLAQRSDERLHRKKKKSDGTMTQTYKKESKTMNTTRRWRIQDFIPSECGNDVGQCAVCSAV